MEREPPPPVVAGLVSVGLALVMVVGRLVLDELVERVVIGLTTAAEVEVGGAVVVVMMGAIVVVLAAGGGVTTDVGFGFGLGVTVVCFKFAKQKKKHDKRCGCV